MSNPDVDRIASLNWEAINCGVLADDLDGPSTAQIASMLIDAEDGETGPWPLPFDFAWQKLSETGYWTPFWAYWWGNPDPLDDLDGFAYNASRVLLPPSLRMPQLSPSGGQVFVTEDFARLRLRILKMWTAINMTGISYLRGEPANEWVRSSIAGIILTGQPGVGKSVFIWYLLIFLLQHKQRVALSTGQSVLEFRYDGVYRSKYPDPVIDMMCTPLQFWSLIDTSGPARSAVTVEKAFPVHAVDCMDCNPPWTKCDYIKVLICDLGVMSWLSLQL
ncbi:hypothetical protein CPB85DRAFT_1284892 [Mucidula mucida]|nr:hypothetical protein CPB85DRAFT_1284892 [Mucidula mucida]